VKHPPRGLPASAEGSLGSHHRASARSRGPASGGLEPPRLRGVGRWWGVFRLTHPLAQAGSSPSACHMERRRSGYHAGAGAGVPARNV